VLSVGVEIHFAPDWVLHILASAVIHFADAFLI